MVLNIVSIHAGSVIDRLMNYYELVNEKEVKSKLMTAFDAICGERSQQRLTVGIQRHLATTLSFEGACVLRYEAGKFFTIVSTKDNDDYLGEGFIEFPSTVGLSGKCFKEKTIIISSYGKNDLLYNEDIDNVLKLNTVYNMMAIPLFVDSANGKVLYNSKDTKKEFIGVLQLLNYQLGNIRKVKRVI